MMTKIYRCDICGNAVNEERLAKPSWSPPPEVEHICLTCLKQLEHLLERYIAFTRAKWAGHDAEKKALKLHKEEVVLESGKTSV